MMVDDLELGQRQSGTTSEEADPSQGGSGTSPTSSSPSGGQGSIEEIEVVSAPTQHEYQNPLLRGKTPAEIEALFNANQQALLSQNEELNRRQPTSAPAPTREEPEPEYENEFLAPVMGTLEKRLVKRFEAMVAPIARAQQTTQVKTAREELREETKHFTTLEPHIDQMLRQQGVDPATMSKADLQTLYHNALGLAAERGINLNTSAPAPTREQPTREDPPMNIPQNRPSSAPLPKGQANQPRQLTEDERSIARSQFGGKLGKDNKPVDHEAEYRKLQDANEDEIVSPGFSRTEW